MGQSATLSQPEEGLAAPIAERVRIWRALAVISLCTAIAVFLAGLTQPLLGFHPFRQTQTAIATWWMLNGSSWIDYETPVLGAPWSVPFEFPLYNWLVAGLVKLTGMPLDAAGRLISFSWLLACLIPANDLFRSYNFSARTRAIFIALFLAAPTYLYWGRAFLMETQALFLGLAFLACMRRFTLHPTHYIWPALAILAGVAAALTKITSCLPWFALAGAIVAIDLYQRIRAQQPFLLHASIAAACAAIPAIVFSVWNHHANELKAANEIAAYFQSTTPEMKAWNFGSLTDRFTPETLEAFQRGLNDTFGLLAPLIAPLLAGLVIIGRRMSRRDAVIIAALVAGFLAPWVAIAPLYVVHHYYQTPSAVLAIAAAAIALSAIADARPRLGLAICVGVMASQLLWFATKYAPTLSETASANTEHQIARHLRGNTPENSVIVIHGRDWSSAIAYYSQRRAVMEPQVMLKAPREDYLARLDRLGRPVGGYPISALVRCPSRLDDDPDAVAVFDAVAAANPTVRIGACNVSTAAGDSLIAPPPATPTLRR